METKKFRVFPYSEGNNEHNGVLVEASSKEDAIKAVYPDHLKAWGATAIEVPEHQLDVRVGNCIPHEWDHICIKCSIKEYCSRKGLCDEVIDFMQEKYSKYIESIDQEENEW